jgi:hypothetical protein
MRIIIVLLVGLLASGCSTFEVFKEYQLSKESESNSIEQEGLSATLAFSKSNSFYSAGILGLPIIPTHIRVDDDNEFKLLVRAEVYKGHELSVKRKPCFILDNEEQLCASRLITSALMYQVESVALGEKQKKWHFLKGLNDSELNVEFTTPWVTLNDIYGVYNYTGAPDYDLITIYYSYTFQCDGKCPDKFKFDGDSFFKVNEDLVSLGFSEYSLKTGSRYYFSRIVQ